MNRYTEDLVLKCNSIDKLESIKKIIVKERRKEEIICNCNHPLVMFPNTHYSYETYKTYICVKCCAIVEDSRNILYSKKNIRNELKKVLYNFFHNLYISLLNEENDNDTEVINEIISFYNFLLKEEFLKDINSLKLEEVKKILNKSYKLFQESKNLDNEVKKIKIKENLNAISYKTCNG